MWKVHPHVNFDSPAVLGCERGGDNARAALMAMPMAFAHGRWMAGSQRQTLPHQELLLELLCHAKCIALNFLYSCD